MALETRMVQVLGRGTNVAFTIDDTAPFDQVALGLQEYLEKNLGLWSGGTIGVDTGRRVLSREQLTRIKAIIETRSGLKVARFWCSSEGLEQVNHAGGDSSRRVGTGPPTLSPISPGLQRPGTGRPEAVGVSAPEQAKPGRGKWASSPKGLPAEAVFVKTTFRSGESIRYPGDVVVLADVNPGAEIMADGDIVVFGRLRGLAHAGAGGDARAAVIALHLEAPRIQIGPYTSLAPAEGQRSKFIGSGPQIAYVRRRAVYVSLFEGRFSRYSRGIPYDR